MRPIWAPLTAKARPGSQGNSTGVRMQPNATPIRPGTIAASPRCQAALKDAEQKVEILLKSAGGEDALEEFDASD